MTMNTDAAEATAANVLGSSIKNPYAIDVAVDSYTRANSGEVRTGVAVTAPEVRGSTAADSVNAPATAHGAATAASSVEVVEFSPNRVEEQAAILASIGDQLVALRDCARGATINGSAVDINGVRELCAQHGGYLYGGHGSAATVAENCAKQYHWAAENLLATSRAMQMQDDVQGAVMEREAGGIHQAGESTRFPERPALPTQEMERATIHVADSGDALEGIWVAGMMADLPAMSQASDVWRRYSQECNEIAQKTEAVAQVLSVECKGVAFQNAAELLQRLARSMEVVATNAGHLAGITGGLSPMVQELKQVVTEALTTRNELPTLEEQKKFEREFRKQFYGDIVPTAIAGGVPQINSLFMHPESTKKPATEVTAAGAGAGGQATIAQSVQPMGQHNAQQHAGVERASTPSSYLPMGMGHSAAGGAAKSKLNNRGGQMDFARGMAGGTRGATGGVTRREGVHAPFIPMAPITRGGAAVVSASGRTFDLNGQGEGFHTKAERIALFGARREALKLKDSSSSRKSSGRPAGAEDGDADTAS